MSERVYPPGQAPEARCNCPRAVKRPTRLPALAVGPDGDKTVFPALPADLTLTIWHRADCEVGA